MRRVSVRQGRYRAGTGQVGIRPPPLPSCTSYLGRVEVIDRFSLANRTIAFCFQILFL